MYATLPFFLRYWLRAAVAAPRGNSGFTAIELLVVIAIMGILAALAGPSFAPILEKWRIRQAVEDMTSTIYFARSEAIKRGGNITVIKNALTSECPQANTAQEWSCGWSVFVDSNNDGKKQGTEETLQNFATPTAVNVMNTSTTGQTRFKVDRWGQLNGLGAQGFVFSPASSAGVASPNTTTLCVSSGGRIQPKPGQATC